jgi:hypothetical protein
MEEDSRDLIQGFFPGIGGTEKNNKNLSQGSRSPGRDFNQEPPEYKTGVLTTRPRCSVNSQLCIILKRDL